MFKVGDKVYSDFYGDGVVIEVTDVGLYSIYVDFSTSGQFLFTKDGVYNIRSTSQEKNIRKVEDRHTIISSQKLVFVI